MGGTLNWACSSGVMCVPGERRALRPIFQGKSAISGFLPHSLTSKQGVQLKSFVWSLTSLCEVLFFLLEPRRQPDFSLCTWERAAEVLSTCVTPAWSWLLAYTLQSHGGNSGCIEFSSGIKRQNGSRTDWIELSCKITYWQSGLHSWVKREKAKRKKKANVQSNIFWLLNCFPASRWGK